MEKTIVAVNNVFVLTRQVIHNKIRRACQQKHNKSRVENTINTVQTNNCHQPLNVRAGSKLRRPLFIMLPYFIFDYFTNIHSCLKCIRFY